MSRSGVVENGVFSLEGNRCTKGFEILGGKRRMSLTSPAVAVIIAAAVTYVASTVAIVILPLDTGQAR